MAAREQRAAPSIKKAREAWGMLSPIRHRIEDGWEPVMVPAPIAPRRFRCDHPDAQALEMLRAETLKRYKRPEQVDWWLKAGRPWPKKG